MWCDCDVVVYGRTYIPLINRQEAVIRMVQPSAPKNQNSNVFDYIFQMLRSPMQPFATMCIRRLTRAKNITEAAHQLPRVLHSLEMNANNLVHVLNNTKNETIPTQVWLLRSLNRLEILFVDIECCMFSVATCHLIFISTILFNNEIIF